MKKMKTKLALLMAAVLMMCSVVLTGCQSKLAPADQVVGAMYDLVVKENAIPMKDLLGFASEDDVRSSLLAEDDYDALLSPLDRTKQPQQKPEVRVRFRLMDLFHKKS